MTGKATFTLCTMSAVLFALLLNTVSAAAQDCAAGVAAAKAEWRFLSKGNHTVPPSMRIDTSDGRHLTGSQVNYAWALIARAEAACGNGGDATALVHLREVEVLLHSAPRSL